MEHEKEVDESWKNAAERDKAQAAAADSGENKIIVDDFQKQEDEPVEEAPAAEEPQAQEGQGPSELEVNFLNYVSSLAFQAMIFLGEIPHPHTNQNEKNVEQAKFLIDTLAVIREKTKGNLNKQEEDLINASIYELQMKYVEVSKKDNAQGESSSE